MKRIGKDTFTLPLELISNNKKTKHSKYTLDTVKEKVIEETIKTRFNFLKAHKGLQSGHVHLLIGRTNKGKSALIESLALENVCNGYNILLFLSEGDKGDLRRRINLSLKQSRKIKTEKDKEKVLKKIHVLEQRDVDDFVLNDPKTFLKKIFDYVGDHKIEVLYFDNFSTCPYGDSTPELQASFFKSFCAFVQRFMIPAFGAIHQSKSVPNNCELELEHLRGNSSFMNSSSFIYGFNNYLNIDPTIRTLKILKSRLNGDLVGTYYQLRFHPLKGEGFYSSDKVMGNNEAKKLEITNKMQKKRF